RKARHLRSIMASPRAKVQPRGEQAPCQARRRRGWRGLAAAVKAEPPKFATRRRQNRQAAMRLTRVAWMLLQSPPSMTARPLFAAALASLASPAAATVAITGVEGELLENVRQFLDDPPCDAPRQAVRRYADELPERLRPALEAFGHYDATVDASLEPARDDCWQVRVTIDPGAPVVVRDVQLAVSCEA